MTIEKLAKEIYVFMHTDKSWTERLGIYHPAKWEDRSQKTKDRYIKLAAFIKDRNIS